MDSSIYILVLAGPVGLLAFTFYMTWRVQRRLQRDRILKRAQNRADWARCRGYWAGGDK